MVKNQILSCLGGVVLSTACLLGVAAKPIDTNPKEMVRGQRLNSELTVSKTSSTSVSLDWDDWEGSGGYTVRVKDLNTGNVVQSFGTFASTCTVSGLTVGTPYRFEVEKAGYIVIDDVVM